jgi:hypothetical protein
VRTLILGLVVAVAGGCTTPAAELLEDAPRIVDVDAAFTMEERAELDACATAWRSFSRGRVDVVFRAASSGGDLRLARSGPNAGGFDRGDRLAWIDAERLYADGFDARTGVHAMCLNLVGQFFRVVLHDARGALSRGDVVPYFTDADRRACDAAGVC